MVLKVKTLVIPVLVQPLPKQLIWDMYGPKLEMITGYLQSIYGAGMELTWATTPNIIPIHYIAIVQDYGKCRKLALIHMFAISFYVEMIWEVMPKYHMVSSYGKCMGLSAVLSP